MAIIIFLILIIFKIKTPYGRHATTGWGIMVNNHWGWFWMEIPALVVFPLLSITGPSEKSPLTWLLIGIWIIHYFYRALIFPFRIITGDKRMPLIIVVSAFLFNVINGLFIGYYSGYLAITGYSLLKLNVGIGFILFFMGMYINRLSDQMLISLRKNINGYKIPKGCLFEYISCPNHFGEIIEWAGFALIAWNLPAMSFAIWTFCNLVPRSLNHHKWYIEKFKDYPKNRKAVIPFVL